MNRKKRLSSTIAIVVILCVLFLLPAFLQSNTYWLHVLCLVGINVILVAGVHTIWSTGEITMGTGGFMAIGAYTSALLMMKLGFSFWPSMLLGGAACALVGLVLGYPFMRTKGVYFSILTLVTGEVFRLVAWYYRSLTGGSVGLTHIPPPTDINIPGIVSISFDTPSTYYYLILCIVLLSLLILYRFQASQIGFVWRTIREKDNLAESVGINVVWRKIFAFTVGCFFTGMAGSVFAHFMHLAAADATGKFGTTTSIYVLIYMVFGGAGTFMGPIVGAIVLTILPEIFRAMKQYQPIIFGALVICVVFFMPGGIAGVFSQLFSTARRIRGVNGTKRSSIDVTGE
jgi:branched-chain amino acid transport system permease protein